MTVLLCRTKQGDREAAAQVIPLVYKEFAGSPDTYMRDERKSHPLQPAALVNEAYLKLIDQTRVDWRNRSHFLGVAANLMRRVLVDHAREKLAAKRGGGAPKVDLDEFEAGIPVQ